MKSIKERRFSQRQVAMYNTLIDTETLRENLENPKWRIIDCRFRLHDPAAGEADWREGHIPGAAYAHLDRDLSGRHFPGAGRHPLPRPEDLDAQFSAWGIGPETQVVAYDDANGAFAARLWWLLRWRGHAAVTVLDGGYSAWQRDEFPVSNAMPEIEPAIFRAGEPLEGIVSVGEVERVAAGEGQNILLDARAPERFRGEIEPIDRRAGHVPHARNRPFALNCSADGRFLSKEQLAAAFSEFSGKGKIIHMCGSGVTACHNVLAMRHAGFANMSLYPGSWSGWIEDSAHPVVTEIAINKSVE